MYKRILVPVDGSETSNKAVVAALQMARENGGRVRLVHVLDELAYLSGYEIGGDLLKIARDYAVKVLDDALDMAKSAGVPADTKLAEAPGARIGEVVADEARSWEADLIVTGTHGRRGVGRVLLGSGAEQVLRLAPVPVLTIRSQESPAH
ncbi:universal stress protein [Ramlibacter montanisoli]|uniref:Universal stress protein n=1 Tax=Ramlibacter montanisoli TaxID=2732512 RepID=A0A849KE68_9BURK|nr:universal stress protein [Ramlibacter montanisoli]NNU43011.1 universal stress protein [Ramlibacter montanisoli]